MQKRRTMLLDNRHRIKIFTHNAQQKCENLYVYILEHWNRRVLRKDQQAERDIRPAKEKKSHGFQSRKQRRF